MSRFSLSWFLAALAVLCLLARLVYPGDAPFFSDVPLFQLLADEHGHAGSFPLTSFRGSSTFVAYGGGALWLIQLFRWLTDSMEWMVFTHALLHGGSAAILLFLLKERLDLASRWLLVWFALSSPLLFYLSRIVWDNGFFVPLSAGLLLALRSMGRNGSARILPWVVLGGIAAFMVNIHLMVVPVLLAAALTACVLLWRSSAAPAWKLGLPALAFFIFLCATAPYFAELLRLYALEHVAEKNAGRHVWGDGRNLWWLLQRSLMFLSTYGAKIMFEHAYSWFLEFPGVPGFLFRIDVFGWVPKFCAVALMFRLAWKGIHRDQRLDWLELMTVFSFFSLLLVLNLLNIPTEAHYFQSTWWLPFVATALVLERLNERWRRGFFAVLVICAAINTAFLLSGFYYVHVNHGSRNGRYGPTFHELKEVSERLCRRLQPGPVFLSLNEVHTSVPVFRYFEARLPECRERSFHFEHAPGMPAWRLEYTDPAPSARLEFRAQ